MNSTIALKVPVLKSVFAAFRPKTLSAAIVPVFVGSALAHKEGSALSPQIILYIIASAMCIQIGTNLINDAIDFNKGADTQERIGPERLAQMKIFTAARVHALGLLFFVLAIVFGIPLVQLGGMVIVTIGLVSVLCGYAYTGGPYPLAYKGLGEIFVVLFFGLVAVSGTFYLFTKRFQIETLVAGLQIGLLCTTLIAINNRRDAAQDRNVNKNTLAVRFGDRFSKSEIVLCLLFPFFLNVYWLLRANYLAALLPLVALPLAIKLALKVQSTAPSSVYNSFLAQASGVFLIFGVMISVGFYFS